MRARRFTDKQKSQWAIDGYVVLEGLLNPTEVGELTRHVDKLFEDHLAQSPEADPKAGMDHRDALEVCEPLIDMIDHPRVFDIVLDLLGPYIQLSMAEVLVRPPNPDFAGFIHTDGGQALRRIRVTETSLPLQLKIQYFLTDVDGENAGNFTLFPGSHLRPYPEDDEDVSVHVPGAVQLKVKAGDAAIFPHSIWHGAAPNRSTRRRKSLIFCYSQMFCRPFDFVAPSAELLERCAPRQRRLLGDLGGEWKPGSYFYAPEDQVEVMAQG